MTTRIKDNQLKGILLLILFILLSLQVIVAQAQPFRERSKDYRGLFASFGSRAVTVSSDIEKIDGTNLQSAGGQVGIVFGNRIARSKIGLIGYYSSTGNTAGTTDLYTSDISANFYPLSLLSEREFLVEPYFTGSVAYDRFKFFGYYVNREPGTTNYSQGEAPYLGAIREVNATAGLGIELKLREDHNFIHLFSEVRFGHNLSSKATDFAFNGTNLRDQMHVSIGISFGAN